MPTFYHVPHSRRSQLKVGVWLGRDLKAENVLLHNNGTWVLCDFGSTTSWSGRYEGSNAIMMAEEHVRKYTTAAYRAPEVALATPIGTVMSGSDGQPACLQVLLKNMLLMEVKKA